MQIQIASDLHIEYLNQMIDVNNFIIPKAPILILAGDIGSLYRYDQLYIFLSKLSLKFKYVLYVPGNHEFYTMNDYKPLPFRILANRLYQLENSISNLYILNKSSVIIENICFIGATLWSKVPEKSIIPKYRVRIKGMNSYQYKSNHIKDLQFISKTLDFCKQKNLKPCVITHYPPLKKCMGPHHSNDKYQFLYFNELDYIFNQYDIHLWIYGHVHYNQQLKIQNCTCLSNQLGRERDNITDYVKDFLYIF